MTIKTTTKKAPTEKVVAKKVVKKTVAGKTVSKSSVKKVTAKKTSGKRPLVYSDEQTTFWVRDGQTLNSLVALRDALDDMENEVYLYHAGGAHNDFANWVASVLSDKKCASDLEKAKTPHSAKTVVVRHLKFYSV